RSGRRVQQRLDLCLAERTVEDVELVHGGVEERVVVLGAADPAVAWIPQARRVKRHTGVDADLLAVHEQPAGVARQRDGEVNPLVRGQRRVTGDLLFLAGAANGDGEAWRRTGDTGAGGQEHVHRGVVAEVEDPGPTLGRCEVDPRRDREVGDLA